MKGGEGKGREGRGGEWKGREEKGREEKGREGKGVVPKIDGRRFTEIKNLHLFRYQISNLATKILETLLENRLNMSSRLWKKLLDDILTSLPYLQTHLGKRSKLATCLMGLLAPPGESLHCLTAEGEVIPFSEFERLRGSLRCMFHRDKMVRAKGYGYLIRRLLDEDARSKRDFVYPSGKLENSADLFILDTFASGAVRSHRSTKHAGFDDERIRKLFNIVATETTEVSLRRSSGEQLALLMEGILSCLTFFFQRNYVT